MSWLTTPAMVFWRCGTPRSISRIMPWMLVGQPWPWRTISPLSERLGGESEGLLDIGIGINTGVALVGNTGTPQKMKYGPRGHTVNLGSRVEGVTKQFGTRIIISPSTRNGIGNAFPVRRLGRVQLAGLLEAVDLFELCGEISAEEFRRHERYEKGLALFEAGRFAEAAEKMRGNLAETTGDLDVPTFQLFAHV